MLVKFLAALLLLPASCRVYGSLYAWLRAWRGGVRAFFIPVVRKGPQTVSRPASFLHALTVYYPMKAGLELLHARAVRPVLRKTIAFVRLRLPGTVPPAPAVVSYPSIPQPPSVPPVPPERIMTLMRDTNIGVISFDIFDTLLLRPVLDPSDIFTLIARKTDPVYGTDFIGMRLTAEAETGLSNARLEDIYACMARRHGLNEKVRQALMEEEIRCERRLLVPRPDAQRLYSEARSLGKRIIAVSDMYLPSALLADILREKGLPVDAVYVSCEHNARKSDGTLYDRVIEAEGVPPCEILHVGDNPESDCARALEKHLCAVLLPGVRDTAFSQPEMREILFGRALKIDPVVSLYLGHAINRLYGKITAAPGNLARVRDLRHLSELTVAPLLTAFALFAATDREIQAGYDTLYFASRDGHLPFNVYNALRERFKAIPGRYFYAGRRSYFSLLHPTFFDFARSLTAVEDIEGYTLQHFLQGWFADTPLWADMKKNCSEEELNTLFFSEKQRCLAILHRFEDELNSLFRERREAARAYYRSVFGPGKERRLVFDLGYSGSVARALSAALESPVDKLYFWESRTNRQEDKNCGSRTRLFMANDEVYVPINLIYEELFSPFEGGVTGFDMQGLPIVESLHMPNMRAEDFAVIAQTCLDWATSFVDLLGDYATCARLDRPEAFNTVMQALLFDVPFCNAAIFKPIRFPDPVFRNRNVSLEKKVERHFPARSVFSGTGFEDPDHVLEDHPILCAPSLRIGIHSHIFHIDMAELIIRYLQDFPAPFDLYVTVADTEFIPVAEKLFSSALLPRLNTVEIVLVPNRGRDVAPWILGMRSRQSAYDLFCHVHTKESAHIGCGDGWRRYLFDNLISAGAAARIIDIFTRHPEIGCLYPDVYSGLHRVWMHVGVPLYGSEHEYKLIVDLLERMGLDDELCRSDLFFSGGTMFWYRPQALHQLFTVPLELEEFAPEPIGVGGTLAHAIERLPALVAVRNGYQARTFTPYPG